MSRSSFTIPLSCHHLWTHALPSLRASISSSCNVLHPGSLFRVIACLVNTFMDSTVSDTRWKHAYLLPMQSAQINTPSMSIKTIGNVWLLHAGKHKFSTCKNIICLFSAEQTDYGNPTSPVMMESYLSDILYVTQFPVSRLWHMTYLEGVTVS